MTTQLNWRKIPLVLISIALFVLFIIHLVRWQGIKVDGYAIMLLILAILPWSLPTFLFVFRSINDAFIHSNLRLIQIGNVKIEQLEKRVESHSKELEQQRHILDHLIVYSMAWYIYDKLKYISLGVLPEYRDRFGEYKYVQNETFDHDLRYLRDHGYLEMFQISDLHPGDNLVGNLRATEMGQQFVQLKEHGVRVFVSSAKNDGTREQEKVEDDGTRGREKVEDNGTDEQETVND
jgi:hypothetical protein